MPKGGEFLAFLLRGLRGDCCRSGRGLSQVSVQTVKGLRGDFIANWGIVAIIAPQKWRKWGLDFRKAACVSCISVLTSCKWGGEFLASVIALLAGGGRLHLDVHRPVPYPVGVIPFRITDKIRGRGRVDTVFPWAV